MNQRCRRAGNDSFLARSSGKTTLNSRRQKSPALKRKFQHLLPCDADDPASRRAHPTTPAEVVKCYVKLDDGSLHVRCEVIGKLELNHKRTLSPNVTRGILLQLMRESISCKGYYINDNDWCDNCSDDSSLVNSGAAAAG